MKRNKKQVLIATALVLGVSSLSGADVVTFQPGGGSGSWHDAGNWSSNSVPDGDDRVVIPSGKTCNVDADATADTMDVQGTLNIEPGRTLTLENNTENLIPVTPDEPDHSIVDGTVNLRFGSSSGSTLAFTEAATHIVSGTGKIVGETTACRITIVAHKTFVNQLATDDNGIRGAMVIEGLADVSLTGTFRNEGIVYANGKGIILASTTILEDIEGAQWESRCGYLEFNREALDLNGDFQALDEPGILTFNQSIRTCGTYIRDYCGAITLAEGKTFKYAQYSSAGNSCENPAQSGSGSGDCSSFFTVSESETGFPCS